MVETNRRCAFRYPSRSGLALGAARAGKRLARDRGLLGFIDRHRACFGECARAVGNDLELGCKTARALSRKHPHVECAHVFSPAGVNDVIRPAARLHDMPIRRIDRPPGNEYAYQMSLNSLARIRYRASRTSRDLKALSTGNWRRIVRRAKNKVVGRALARSGIFRRLWR
jgi:hypothetical protein